MISLDSNQNRMRQRIEHEPYIDYKVPLDLGLIVEAGRLSCRPYTVNVTLCACTCNNTHTFLCLLLSMFLKENRLNLLSIEINSIVNTHTFTCMCLLFLVSLKEKQSECIIFVVCRE